MNELHKYSTVVTVPSAAHFVNFCEDFCELIDHSSIGQHRNSVAEFLRTQVLGYAVQYCDVPEAVLWLTANHYEPQQMDIMLSMSELELEIYLVYTVKSSDYTMLKLVMESE